jgi:hypothetical protein
MQRDGKLWICWKNDECISLNCSQLPF